MYLSHYCNWLRETNEMLRENNQSIEEFNDVIENLLFFCFKAFGHFRKIKIKTFCYDETLFGALWSKKKEIFILKFLSVWLE